MVKFIFYVLDKQAWEKNQKCFSIIFDFRKEKPEDNQKPKSKSSTLAAALQSRLNQAQISSMQQKDAERQVEWKIIIYEQTSSYASSFLEFLWIRIG